MFGNKYFVSTVWLGMDHNWSGEGKPIIFETMVFAYDEDGEVNFSGEYQERYATEKEALAGHAKAVETFLLVEEPADP